MSKLLILQLVFIAFSAFWALVFALGNWREEKAKINAIQLAFAGYGGIQLVILVIIALNHVNFPLNLEAMELSVLQHVIRAANGAAIYVKPSPNFIPLAYNPLFYYISIPFTKVFGIGLPALRVVSTIGLFGIIVLVYKIIRSQTESVWWGIMGVGLYSASYRAMDTYLDNAHSDSMLVLFIILGGYLVHLHLERQDGTIRLAILGILISSIAFWFKQSAIVFSIATLLVLMWKDKSKARFFGFVVFLLVIPIFYLYLAPRLFGPWFHVYTFQLPRNWVDFEMRSTILRPAYYSIRYFAVLGFAGVASLIFKITNNKWAFKHLDYWHVMLPVAILSGICAALDPGGNNNVFIPMATWIILLGVIGLSRVTNELNRERKWGLIVLGLGVSFALLLYNPLSVLIPNRATEDYFSLISYLNKIEGKVAAPWIGQLPSDYEFSPGAHMVPLIDLYRGTENGLTEFPSKEELFAPITTPTDDAFLLLTVPIEDDGELNFLRNSYRLVIDFGEQYKSLSTLPKRYTIGWPRYLYQYNPSADVEAQN